MNKHKPLDDLEMFELLQLAYPDRFPDDENETWDDAMEFAGEFGSFEHLADLLGRVAMLTMPMQSGLTKRPSHCLGQVVIINGQATMVAAVRRDFKPDEKNEQQP